MQKPYAVLQGGDFTPAFLKYFKNGSEKPVFISFSLHFTIVDYYPPSFHFIFTMRVFSENGFFWINWKGRVKSLGKVSNRATYLSWERAYFISISFQLRHCISLLFINNSFHFSPRAQTLYFISFSLHFRTRSEITSLHIFELRESLFHFNFISIRTLH